MNEWMNEWIVDDSMTIDWILHCSLIINRLIDCIDRPTIDRPVKKHSIVIESCINQSIDQWLRTSEFFIVADCQSIDQKINQWIEPLAIGRQWRTHLIANQSSFDQSFNASNLHSFDQSMHQTYSHWRNQPNSSCGNMKNHQWLIVPNPRWNHSNQCYH